MDTRYPHTTHSSSQKSARKQNQSHAPAPLRRHWPAEVDQLPKFMHEYFEDVKDGLWDRHRGFIVVFVLLGKSSDEHNMIRLDLTIEMSKNRTCYLKLYSDKERFDYIMNTLTPTATGTTPKDKWMTIPDLSFLLAQKYKHAVAVIASTEGYSQTYFSLKGVPSTNERLMCLAWVNDNHFMAIRLKPGCPIPPTSTMWGGNYLENALTWSDRFIHRMSAYSALKRVHGGHIVGDHDTRSKIVPVVVFDTEDSITFVNLGEDLSDRYV